ncbi:Brix-domain-containing protein [Terfezia boudieri ATCC MYA-4762]|uniref:U3 small nucleolar ribonucleoprotein protein IMP4 n=1 Tax=Terfezia boudieri ATCC MYA-4762 TaxID=1051890 RepID=A0A3N4LF13_9PEZI|nr:Brix-domain-containing protein [Terfezia boudieri ATCC MYA-4762]
MLRRANRERCDFLYRKALALKDSAIAERRQKLRESLASGKPLPKDIANDVQLRADFRFDESNPTDFAEDEDALDDEYSTTSGLVDPKILITTSRSPSSRLLQFSKELRLLLPLSIRLNRGNTVLPQLTASSLATGITDLILLHEHRGVPTSLTISHFPHGPTAQFSLHNVVLRHDIPNSQRGTVSEAYPHLIFDGFKTKLGKRVVQILKNMFPSGVKRDSGRVVTFKAGEGDYISVRHHVYVKTGWDKVELAEVGPRMEMKLFEIKLGTVDNKNADYEWRLANYTRTAKKRDLL